MGNSKEEPVVMGYQPDFFPSAYGPLYPQPAAPFISPATTSTKMNRANPSRSAQPPIDEPTMKRSHCIAWSLLAGGLVLILVALITVEIIFSRDQPPSFQISSLSVSPFNLSSTTTNSSLLTANWNATFFVTSPNFRGDLHIFYERVDTSVLYHGVSLSPSASIAPFLQKEGDQNYVDVSGAFSYVVSDSFVGFNDIIGEWQHGAVNLTVVVDGTVLGIDSGQGGERRPMRVSCNDVIVGFSDNVTAGTLLGGPRKCKVDLDLKM